MTVLTFANRKGGVGKTTSVINLAAEFSDRGKRVLCVDADPQGTLTVLAGFDPEGLDEGATTAAAFGGNAPEPLETGWGGGLWPANELLAGAEVQLTDPKAAGPNVRLRRALARARDEHDLVLVDTPPSLGKVAINGLCAADRLILPVGCSLADVAGLTRMFETIEALREYGELSAALLGVVGTRAEHTKHSRETVDEMRRRLDRLFLGTIPKGVALQDAQTKHEAVRQYDAHSKPAAAYAELADAILARLDDELAARRAA